MADASARVEGQVVAGEAPQAVVARQAGVERHRLQRCGRSFIEGCSATTSCYADGAVGGGDVKLAAAG